MRGKPHEKVLADTVEAAACRKLKLAIVCVGVDDDEQSAARAERKLPRSEGAARLVLREAETAR